jgi:hypothetical protein
MKKSGLLWALVFLTLGAFGQSINWASSTDQGLVRAQREGKRTFLLITAPSWCSYCQVLERDVLSDAQIIAAINRDFVPVKILDTDSDIGRFDFTGFPTVYILDSEGNILQDFYTLDVGRMQVNLSEFAGPSPPTAQQSKFDQILNVAMYGEADWSGKLYERSGLTPEEAMEIADSDPRVDFFFFTKGGQMVLPTGVFKHGTAVFFQGNPWWGGAPGLADGYVKKQSLRMMAPVSP